MRKYLLLSALCLLDMTSVCAKDIPSMTLKSPNGKLCIQFNQTASPDGKMETIYNVGYDGKTVIKDSKVGLQLDNKVWEQALAKKIVSPEIWMDNMEIDSVSYGSHDETWKPVLGERNEVRDHYNSGTVYMSKKDGSKYRLNIEARAYDGGVGFRYYFPEHPDAIFHKVVGDLTEYSFEPGAKAWVAEWAQAPYSLVPVGEIKNPAERALTVELPNGLFASLTDADVDDWAQTRFISSKDKPNTINADLYSTVDVVTYAASPWKVILVADRAGDLIENNDIVLNFNEPCRIENTDYIKGGTMLRDVILTTESAIKAIDFCKKHNIPNVLFCWKWYMPVTSHDGDALKPVDKFDLQKAIAYAKENGIDVWLYMNQHALMKPNLDEVLATYKKWGVAGIKPGFVEYCTHRWAVWVHDVVRLAAKHELMVNIHDEFRPSGFSRTYPNLVTQEGIRGQEEFPDATHNTVLPFTRLINGAGDYTIGYMDKRIKNTHAHQLALALIMFSPVESVFWYDTPDRFNDEPDLEWFEEIKTTFDDSKVLNGKPGENITVARRNGDEWWLGAITNTEARSENVVLSFLDPDKTYLAKVYTDDDKIETKTKVRCARFIVKGNQIMKFNFKPSGGAAVHFIPVEKSEAKKHPKYKGQVL